MLLLEGGHEGEGDGAEADRTEDPDRAAVQLCPTGLGSSVRDGAEGPNGVESVAKPDPSAGHGTFQEETHKFQKTLLERALKAADWNVATAARQLDLTRGHVYALIKAFGLTRER